MSPTPMELVQRYLLDDLPGALTAGSRLHNILVSLAKGQPLTAPGRAFLSSKGAGDYVQLVDGLISEAEYEARAKPARDRRLAEASLARQLADEHAAAQEKEAEARQAAMWERLTRERIARESDPRYIAKMRNRELRSQFGIDGHIEETHFHKVMGLLRKLDAGTRLSDLEALWLQSEGREYQTQEVLTAHHRLEANHCLATFAQTADPWMAVNASGHLRKCGAPAEAVGLLKQLQASALKAPKLRSAVLTTQGGALRDLGQHEDALALAEVAQKLLPTSFRPCTLLGAINIELGNFNAGHEWYRQAEKLGAKPSSIESDLRGLLARMAPEQRKLAIDELTRIDSDQYGWMKQSFARRHR